MFGCGVEGIRHLSLEFRTLRISVLAWGSRGFSVSGTLCLGRRSYVCLV